jgi:hypothetical protein
MTNIEHGMTNDERRGFPLEAGHFFIRHSVFVIRYSSSDGFGDDPR